MIRFIKYHDCSTWNDEGHDLERLIYFQVESRTYVLSTIFDMAKQDPGFTQLILLIPEPEEDVPYSLQLDGINYIHVWNSEQELKRIPWEDWLQAINTGQWETFITEVML